MEVWKLLILLKPNKDCLSRITVGANIFSFELGKGKGFDFFNQELSGLERITCTSATIIIHETEPLGRSASMG